MSNSFKNLNKYRKAEYHKDPAEESFLNRFNNSLQSLEKRLYSDAEVNYPFIFSFGPPRSGTTLITQLIAHCLDLGYISNFIARFWKAPVCGIRLSNQFFEDKSYSSFRSNYGSTEDLLDVHEFGYFWREWLKKDDFESIKRFQEQEKEINWEGLYEVLANMQSTFDKPMVFKNILGSYHLEKFRQVLDGQILYVYIQRDSLDTAISILNARKKYYGDPTIWWSYVPPQIDRIKDQDYWTQIAGQVHFLNKFYNNQLSEIDNDHIVRVSYKDLCSDPGAVIDQIRNKYTKLTGEEIDLKQKPPEGFKRRTYDNNDQLKKNFQEIFNDLKNYESE